MSDKSIKTVGDHLGADQRTLMSISSMIYIIAGKMTDDDQNQVDFPYVISSLTLIEDVLDKVTESMERSYRDLFHLAEQYEPEPDGESG